MGMDGMEKEGWGGMLMGRDGIGRKKEGRDGMDGNYPHYPNYRLILKRPHPDP